MRANHIPASDRIRARIGKLQLRLDGCFSNKRFYPTCKGCGATNIEVSIKGRHRTLCPYQGLEAEIRHYERLLKVLNLPK